MHAAGARRVIQKKICTLGFLAVGKTGHRPLALSAVCYSDKHTPQTGVR